MYRSITFFNPYHNGDVHASRTFVKSIVDYMKPHNIPCNYAQINVANILMDIDGLACHNRQASLPIGEMFIVKNGDLYINTWYAAGHHKYLNKYNLTYNCLYHLFNEITNSCFNFDLSAISSDKSYFFPDIDYSKYQIQSIDDIMSNNKRFTAFISNCDTMSGQAVNFDFNPIISTLADKYPDIIWIPTNIIRGRIIKRNVIYSADIIRKNGFDLNENGYLSTKCDMIVGRASGSHSFAYNKYNFFKSTKKNICFTDIDPLWYDKNDFELNYTNKIIHSKSTNPEEIIDTISGEL